MGDKRLPGSKHPQKLQETGQQERRRRLTGPASVGHFWDLFRSTTTFSSSPTPQAAAPQKDRPGTTRPAQQLGGDTKRQKTLTSCAATSDPGSIRAELARTRRSGKHCPRPLKVGGAYARVHPPRKLGAVLP
ncbi:hypothetical protein NDU88_006444 [Pleurodeles waltl]|uniref:Uncharacterized protein n=1 Tax=Pleurodeles waltl TaxID=8319 RepID=A0AAV7PLG3_PLEWA|nr:hypothetical protein NDU88_006444 [Pleurodeles waltl]